MLIFFFFFFFVLFLFFFLCFFVFSFLTICFFLHRVFYLASISAATQSVRALFFPMICSLLMFVDLFLLLWPAIVISKAIISSLLFTLYSVTASCLTTANILPSHSSRQYIWPVELLHTGICLYSYQRNHIRYKHHLGREREADGGTWASLFIYENLWACWY